MNEKRVRVFALARELRMESRDLVHLAQRLGLDVKSQLSILTKDAQDVLLTAGRQGRTGDPTIRVTPQRLPSAS